MEFFEIKFDESFAAALQEEVLKYPNPEKRCPPPTAPSAMQLKPAANASVKAVKFDKASLRSFDVKK